MNIFQVIDGNKTYFTIIVAIVYAISAALYGAIDWNMAVQLILAALGLGGVRSALKKLE